MTIEYCDVFPVLAKAVSGCEPTKQYWDELLPYVFINDLVRFVCDRGYPDFDGVLGQFGELVERLLTEGDDEVRNLAHDALDTVCSHKDLAERDAVVQHFGPTTMKAWERICGGRER